MRHLLLVASEKPGLLTAESCRRAQCSVSVVAERPTPGCEKADLNIRVDDLLATECVLQEVAAHHARRPIGAVLARDEYAVEPAASLASSLGVPGFAPEAGTAARDKLYMRRRLAAAGVRVPSWRAARTISEALDAAHEFGFPVVIKPRRLSGSVGVVRANTDTELCEAWAIVQTLVAQQPRHAGPATDSALVEGFIDGVEYSVEVLAVRGTFFPLAVVDKPDCMSGPFFEERLFITPSSAPMSAQHELVDTAIAAMKAVGIEHGPCHVELRRPFLGGMPVVIELAARTGGSRDVLLQLSKGVDLISLTVDAAFGIAPTGLPHWSEASSYCAIRGISSGDTGTVLSINGVDDARQVPLIQSIHLRAMVGTVIFQLPYANPKIGPIIGNGPEYDAVRTAVENAHRMIRVSVRPSEPF